MHMFTLNTPAPASRTTTTDEALSLIWWPAICTLVGMVVGVATAQALTGDFLPLLGLSLAFLALPVGGWVWEVWPSLDEISDFIIGGYVPPVYEEQVLPVPHDGWAEAMLAEEMMEDLPDWAILPLPAPAPLPHTSREVLVNLLREASTQALEHLLDLPKDEEFDMHASACKDFIWV